MPEEDEIQVGEPYNPAWLYHGVTITYGLQQQEDISVISKLVLAWIDGGNHDRSSDQDWRLELCAKLKIRADIVQDALTELCNQRYLELRVLVPMEPPEPLILKHAWNSPKRVAR